ncbi:PspC domain-containing protein [Streptococcus phocae subsp. phocae]|uniref:Phage shock protein PspC N-terminal domain-containing protein n=1 Tax=Streptococcus phocae TaxID=119224 RepID=A0A0P6SJY4_9STRE|nr:PspC domain-containing protein [Streptococcus phocae]KGR73232.1 membrane protein [Streptococcus phocae subsp. salmonis]KPJ22612.1 hypothetical protein AKK44_02870 [Streptococcus phocae]
METKFYKQHKNKMVSGVVAGLADKYNWDLPLARVLAALLIYFTRFGVILYILLAIFLPFKEDLIQNQKSRGPRRRKDAEVIDNEDWFW